MATTTKTTNLGPLTTTFSAPSHCLSQTFRYTRSDIKCGNEGCGWLHLGNTSDSRCLPSGYHALTDTEFFYSPGVCPKSYTAACSNVFTSGSELQTIATCCPKLFTCQTGTRWPWYQTEACVREFPSTLTLFMTYIEENSKTRTTSTTGIGVNAFGIEIRNSSTVSSLPSSVSASPTPTQQASADSGNDSATDTSGQLSVGAKAGIGVGAGVGGLLVLLFAAYFLWKVWNSRQSKAAAAGDARPEYRSELQGSSNVNVYKPPMELPAEQHRAELEGLSAAELDGSRGVSSPATKTTTERFELG